MDIVWVHNEDELNPDDPDYIQLSDGHIHRLVISAAFPEDSGTYICEAYNDFGEADTACELLVLGLCSSVIWFVVHDCEREVTSSCLLIALLPGNYRRRLFGSSRT